MSKEMIVLPVILLVLLTIVVWARMLVVRMSAMKLVRIHPEKMKSQKAKELLPEEANIPAENFINLFEVPVLFYVLAVFLYVSDNVSLFYLGAGFTYVALRYVHSFIALTYNKVIHRFQAYLLSCLVLWVMWGAFAYHAIVGVS
jgi:hypothetical protein